ARWRKAAGVEPTKERLTSLTGFEARAHHRVWLPSIVLCQHGRASDTGDQPTILLCSRGAAGRLPVRVGAQPMRVAYAAGVAHAVKKFEDLDGALAAQAGGVAKGLGFDLAPCGVLSQRAHQR